MRSLRKPTIIDCGRRNERSLSLNTAYTPAIDSTMLRACTRLAPRLAPRAEAAVGTRSMSLAGMKGAARLPGVGLVGLFPLPLIADAFTCTLLCRL